MNKIIEGILEVIERLIIIKMQEGSYYYDDLSDCRSAVNHLKTLYNKEIKRSNTYD